MIRRLRAWWQRRKEPLFLDECQAPGCGRSIADAHHVTTEIDLGPEAKGPGFSGATVTATFCPEHCEGNCDHEHAEA